MPAIIQHQLLGMKANVVSYNAIIDGVHAMGPHRLLATSDCDLGIEYLIEIVCDRCMFWGSLYVWGLFPRPDPRRGRGGSPDAREDIVAARELLISEARLARLRGLNQ